VSGHRLGLGLLGGLSLIGEFYYPDSGVRERIGYLAGASGQLELRHGLALEPRCHLQAAAQQLRSVQWVYGIELDFPVLAKYHVAKLGRAPFVEAGPSFRVARQSQRYNPSHYGATVGAGAETRTGWALLSTALRYTRWAKDGFSSYLSPGAQHDYARTNANTVELMFGIGFLINDRTLPTGILMPRLRASGSPNGVVRNRSCRVAQRLPLCPLQTVYWALRSEVEEFVCYRAAARNSSIVKPALAISTRRVPRAT